VINLKGKIMLILIGQVARVTAKTKKETDENTGHITEVVETHAHIQHSANLSPDADLLIDKIKLKDSSQVDAFRKATGKNVQVAVRTWNQGGKSGYWLEAGVLPTVQSQQ
jgi:hypothetical protein